MIAFFKRSHAHLSKYSPPFFLQLEEPHPLPETHLTMALRMRTVQVQAVAKPSAKPVRYAGEKEAERGSGERKAGGEKATGS